MIASAHFLTTVVRSVKRQTSCISTYELSDPDDWDLPPFSAGAHIDVHIPKGPVRTYSLCGDPTDRKRYWISIKREESGRGGSRALHRLLEAGTLLAISLPRNTFPLATAGRHIFIAGGIGITPFVSMAKSVVKVGERFCLHYAGKSPETIAFRDYFEQMAMRDPVTFYYSEVAGSQRLDVGKVLAEVRPGEHVYCCGPSGLLDEVLKCTEHWEPGLVNVENFGGRSKAQRDVAFTVQLKRSGRTVDVGPAESIVDALRRSGIEINSSCEAGVCSTCKVRYLGGVPVHRDLVLTRDERQEFLLPCVSRCSSPYLVLDL